ncbi:MAG: hypothetical protein IJL17_09950 [Kiritimatiellae bacterium]|nr:hypothetical protein [Kiritimatiellia bacterium]
MPLDITFNVPFGGNAAAFETTRHVFTRPEPSTSTRPLRIEFAPVSALVAANTASWSANATLT